MAQAAEGEKMFKDMSEEGVAPNTDTFNMLIMMHEATPLIMTLNDLPDDRVLEAPTLISP